jgi:hypothetical protein
MSLRSHPRRLRLSALSLPLLVTVGCSTTTERHRSEARTWRDAGGTCWRMPAYSCRPDATCNPPSPERVDCPDDLSTLSSDNYRPPPPAPRRWRDAAGKCFEETPVACPSPEVATCNPPPPYPIDCPADLSTLSFDAFVPPQPPPLPKLPDGPIRKDASGTCWSDPPASCPPPEEGTTCNPPPPERVPCPPGAE